MFNHFRLTFRLIFDQRVSFFLKIFLIGVPVLYLFSPIDTFPDILPMVGLLDDFALFGLTSLIFVNICPSSLVDEHRMMIQGKGSTPAAYLDQYRDPQEVQVLAFTFTILALGILGTGGLGGLGLLSLFLLGYVYSSIKRGKVLSNTIQVTPRQLPRLHKLLWSAQRSLPPLQVNLFVQQNPEMNAYTFGYHEPYTIVLTSGLVEKLTDDELQAVIGHELGHIHFGHTRLVQMMGGVWNGLKLFFNKWSRTTEYSADRVALLTSGCKSAAMVSALLKITSGLPGEQIDVQDFINQVNNKDHAKAAVAEVLNTHPMMTNRIRALMVFEAQMR